MKQFRRSSQLFNPLKLLLSNQVSNWFNLSQLIKIFSEFLTAALVFISRLDILPANVNPLGSFGFFGNPVFYAISIVLFDLFVKGIYPGFWLTYLGFACYPLLGQLAKSTPKDMLKKQILFLPLASLLFFLISNFGVWWYWYDHTLTKFFLCYALAVPFYARTLAGDMLFGYGYLLAIHFRSVKEKVGSWMGSGVKMAV